MKRELTPAQIDELYAFVKRKGVDYYDLQIELVDHLASEIEQKIEDYPALTFEKALESVYAGFGIFGFTEVIEKAHFAVARRSTKLWWSYFKQFWKLPRLLFTIALIGFVWGCCLEFGINSVISVNAGLIVMNISFEIYRLWRNKSRIKLISYLAYTGSPLEGLQSAFPIYYATFFSDKALISSWIISVIIGLVWISIWAGHQTRSLFLEEQKRLYPQAFA